MVLVDSDVFVLDLFYPKDKRAKANKAFIELDGPQRATTIFNVLEICGIASFNKSPEEVKRLFYEFHQIYHLEILYPEVSLPSAEEFLKRLLAGVFSKILFKMNFSDALILSTAEPFALSAFVTWNTKHFEGRTAMQLSTPVEFLAQREPESPAT